MCPDDPHASDEGEKETADAPRPGPAHAADAAGWISSTSMNSARMTTTTSTTTRMTKTSIRR